jgi:hypothetical protein
LAELADDEAGEGGEVAFWQLDSGEFLDVVAVQQPVQLKPDVDDTEDLGWRLSWARRSITACSTGLCI